MLGFFAFVFFLLIAILIIGLALVGSIIRWLFGSGGQGTSGRRDSDGQDTRSRTTHTQQGRSGKKVFGDDEGEYVDYEEVEE